MTDNPYPTAVIVERVARVEARQDTQEASISSLITTTAVHGEQVTSLRDDIKELNSRLANIMRGVWALVLVLIPVAASLAVIAWQS